jgi:hypothetical protein
MVVVECNLCISMSLPPPPTRRCSRLGHPISLRLCNAARRLAQTSRHSSPRVTKRRTAPGDRDPSWSVFRPPGLHLITRRRAPYQTLSRRHCISTVPRSAQGIWRPRWTVIAVSGCTRYANVGLVHANEADDLGTATEQASHRNQDQVPSRPVRARAVLICYRP